MDGVTMLRIEPLSAEAFAPFGDVVEAREAAPRHPINDGTAMRWDGLCELKGPDARFVVGVVRAQPRALPLTLAILERHRLASQVFLPWTEGTYLVVVSPPGEAPAIDRIRCFRVTGRRGVHFRPGTWHHPLIALDAMDFLVVDQPSPDGVVDCDVVAISSAKGSPLVLPAGG